MSHESSVGSSCSSWQAPDKGTGFQPNKPGKLDLEAPADCGAVKPTDRTVPQTDVEPPVRWLLPVVREDNMATVPLLLGFSSVYLPQFLLSRARFRDGLPGGS